MVAIYLVLAREAFYEWNVKHPDLAKQLMETFDGATIRAIHAEIKQRPYCLNLLSVTPRSPSRSHVLPKSSSLADLAAF